ncbi:Methyltransferase domain-containing protein [Noviherbaspirillum humi]|uniref:Methyltransferase domain-containing protein n=1 Tax=Noviherbaspirillum humi TaxID=1688639 RepID=A0A239GPX9_9BURK|nr:class I SAM-dependent methyltransferase [Noviherbaspirillum humi]SNS71031.1 Methyltransferase domain-containing protein [Noviherbaspirillum humi]
MNEVNTSSGFYLQLAAIAEAAYGRPEREEDLLDLQEMVAEALEAHDILELACGTGYWSQLLQDEVAISLLATDICPEVLDIARTRDLDEEIVSFAQADAFDPKVEGDFSACFIGFFWSHVPRQDQDRLLAALRARLGAGALLVMVDDNLVEDDENPIARTDAEGNTYQFLRTPDGERVEVLKNFPTDSALRKKLAAHAREVRVERLHHYWMLTCKLK